MPIAALPRRVTALFALLACAWPLAHAQPAPDAPASTAKSEDLAGLWKARRWFGPAARGALTIRRDGDTWRADLAGHDLPVRA